MGQVLHGSATTTEAFRRAIQHSQESLRTLSKCKRCPSPTLTLPGLDGPLYSALKGKLSGPPIG
ncbi:hypothetical protein ELG65_02610 [Rhizobium leguminosarum]|nr:hypothetical protein ELG85_02670 [Rhizobium leguminosarum]TBG66858.1 hypothetical protein ELG74_02775 [Rhizobium leguminosarum]TBH10147.1 hypothetical protein ELG68_02715 [Rhizobium leguminosarum]TBH57385.1 hypothetical protein ELG65_02610 [Rhizobium leguminosarum]